MHPGHPGDVLAEPAPELPLRPPANRVSPRAKTWWRLRATAVLTVFLVVQLGVLAVAAGPFPLVMVILTVVLGAAYLLVVPSLLFRISRWEVTDRAVYTLTGWLVREWRIAPISRVQTVDTERGPLQQLLRLATVTVTTASARGAVRIRGLDKDDAAELARVLTETTHATPGDAT